MFDWMCFYGKLNERAQAGYEQSVAAVAGLLEDGGTPRLKNGTDELRSYLRYSAGRILRHASLEKALREEAYFDRPVEVLSRENAELYHEVLPEQYGTSYANPAYAADCFGPQLGPLLAFFALRARQLITFAFLHKTYKMEEHTRLFLDLCSFLEEKAPDYEPLRVLLTRNDRKEESEDGTMQLRESFDPAFTYYTDIAREADLRDLRYLYRYGSYITENEFQTAQFLAGYPDEKLRLLARQTVRAYLTGFTKDNKDRTGRDTVMVGYSAGHERILRHLMEALREEGLTAIVAGVPGATANRQYPYDHRFDHALYLDEPYTQLAERRMEGAYQGCSAFLGRCSGVLHFGKFGEPPFSPEEKAAATRLSPEQEQLFRTHQNNRMMIHNRHYPREKTSFTLISLPVPEIGPAFREIFEDFLEINMLDSERYEGIQQKLIDALDKAEAVRVLGAGENKTDITVKLRPLSQPERETNFVNCGADLNIPVGEVFTSPQLAGTNGLLHVREAFLHGLKFTDLRLTFRDGYVTEYTCANFGSEEENKRYVFDNLFTPHATLPLGEFAIGTNTLAYVSAKKHGILAVLPVLIIEKMGPHFAIGDTCFTFEEDRPVFNSLDGKEVTARENEKTAQRKTNPNEAYTFRHMDITLPYEEIRSIAALPAGGKPIDLIRDGRFALSGTEALNGPLEGLGAGR
jgi:aminopeptidase